MSPPPPSPRLKRSALPNKSQNRTARAVEGVKPGIVDDYRKMSDDFAQLVEKIVRFLVDFYARLCCREEGRARQVTSPPTPQRTVQSRA